MPDRTPAQIQSYIDEKQYLMDGPAQLFGDEPNAYGKDWDSTSVRWLIAAAWAYENAAGNQSVPAVYKQVNDGSQTHMADRWYLPSTPRDMRNLEKAGIPVFGIESKHQLADFDVFGSSISYPVLLVNVVKYLEMSDVPSDRKVRQAHAEDYPFVVIGGQAYGAPEPLAPIADAVWCGEVEEELGNPGIQTVTQRIEDFKTAGVWGSCRLDCYTELAREFPFLYFPHVVDVRYGYENRTQYGLEAPSKRVHGYVVNTVGLQAPFLKRIVKNLNAVEPLSNPPLLYNDPAMGAGDIEVGRGCPAWCSFCALTYRQKPYRQRDVDYMVEFAKEFKRNTGSVEMVPFAPDFPMHTQKRGLVSGLLEQVSDEVDSGAMRVDDFIADPEYITLQVLGGMRAVTLGVEGNSQRTRDLVGKGCADEDVREAVTRGIRAGITKFKLFMIANFPGEDEGDVFHILQLAKDLADIREASGKTNIRIQFSWTPLLIEANTPFQWFAPPSPTRALGDVWEEFRDLKVEFKLGGKGEPNKAVYFQACQRASREVGEILLKISKVVAARLGGGTWGGLPRKLKREEYRGPDGEYDVGTAEAIELEMKAAGFYNGFDDIFDEREKNDLFGWEFIDQGINTELLWSTYVQMREFVEWTDSHTYNDHFADDYHGNEWLERCDTKCYGKTCGVCDVDDLKIRKGYIHAALTEDSRDLSEIRPIDEQSQAMRVRCRVFKSPEKRFVMNDHWRFHVRRAAYRALDGMEGSVRVAKRSFIFSSDATLYKDWTAGVDYVDFCLTDRVSAHYVKDMLAYMNAEMSGIQIDMDAWDIYPAASSNVRRDVDLSLWEMEIDETPGKVLARIEEWHQADEVRMLLRGDGGYFMTGPSEHDAKAFCDDLWLVQDGTKAKLKMLVRGRPSPYDIYAALMHKASWVEAAKLAAVRLESFLEWDADQADFFRPMSVVSGATIPMTPLDRPYHDELTPREVDEKAGTIITEMAFG